MENLVPDQKFLDRLCESAERIHAFIADDLIKLKDKDADIFSRYMAFARTNSYLNLMKAYLENFRETFALGHDLRNEIFNTKNARENGWGHSCKKNPFFINDDSSECYDDLPENVKEFFTQLTEEIAKRVEEKQH